MQVDFDVGIVGGGPAGSALAAWDGRLYASGRSQLCDF